MKIKTADLTGPTLDWAVASIEALPKDRLHLFYGKPAIDRECLGRIDTLRCEFSTNWAQGGPIIEREGIYLRANDTVTEWAAGALRKNRLDKKPGTLFYAKTPLIAAMRCFVSSKLGDEVDIPDELV